MSFFSYLDSSLEMIFGKSFIFTTNRFQKGDYLFKQKNKHLENVFQSKPKIRIKNAYCRLNLGLASGYVAINASNFSYRADFSEILG